MRNLWHSSKLRKWPVESLVTRCIKTLYLFIVGGSVYSDSVIMWKSKYRELKSIHKQLLMRFIY